jgi:hypothetical protein
LNPGNFVFSDFLFSVVSANIQKTSDSVTKEAVIKKLGGFSDPPFTVLVDDQDVGDIVTGMVQKHLECTHHYDVIFPMFDKPGSWKEVGRRLFDFCKEQLAYSVESIDLQLVSTPGTILKRGYSDCKGYALFIGGIIDAMKRAGEDVEWCYRFGSYKLFNSSPGHVFVVINPSTDRIWVDPCMDTFNSKFPFPYYKIDEYVETCRAGKLGAIGYVGGHIPGGMTKFKPKPGVKGMAAIGSAEQSLLDSLNEYTEGGANAVQYAQSSQTVNTICLVIIAGASYFFPIIAAVFAVIKLGAIVVSDEFGPNSEAAILIGDIAKNPLLAPGLVLESLINGKTFESDQYRAAQFYQFYVLGNSKINALNKVSDSMVAPALQWFIDRTGVFISGAEHIIGLMTSPGAYEQYVSVNAYTTTDANRINAASNVAMMYWSFSGVAGSWANTLGVYDTTIANIAIAQNETVEAAAAQASYTNVYSAPATNGPNAVTQAPASASTFPVIPVLLVAAAAVILIPSSKK